VIRLTSCLSISFSEIVVSLLPASAGVVMTGIGSVSTASRCVCHHIYRSFQRYSAISQVVFINCWSEFPASSEQLYTCPSADRHISLRTLGANDLFRVTVFFVLVSPPSLCEAPLASLKLLQAYLASKAMILKIRNKYEIIFFLSM
jgi:hypothetical protein